MHGTRVIRRNVQNIQSMVANNITQCAKQISERVHSTRFVSCIYKNTNLHKHLHFNNKIQQKQAYERNGWKTSMLGYGRCI